MFCLKKTKRLSIVLLSIGYLNAYGADVIIDNNDGTTDSTFNNSSINTMQSFTATKTGLLKSIAVPSYYDNSGNLCTLNIYSGGGSTGTKIHTQSNVALSTTMTSLTNFTLDTITISSDVPITSGNTYTFELTPASCSVLGHYKTDVYSGGAFYSSSTGTQATWDYNFEIVQGDAAPTGPTLTSATYDASTGVLTITGSNLSTDSIDETKLTLTGEGGATYTLTEQGAITASSATSISITLNSTNKEAVNLLLNKDGTSSTGATTYNLAAAANWDTTSATESAHSTLAVTVSNVPRPTLTSATYDASTGVLNVTGTNFVKRSGASNDIDATKLSLSGEGGNSYTLTSGSTEVTSSTSFSITLSSTDKANVNGILNKDGTTAVSGNTYNIAGAENWSAGYSGTDADSLGNGITVSNLSAPTITSATYNAGTGLLSVTGTNFVKYSGASNDVDISKFTFTGEGGSTYTLTSSVDIEITSSTSFSVSLNSTDKSAINQILNKNGTSSTDATTYNLSVVDDWNGIVTGGDISDTTNAITVSNVSAPAITSATYDSSTGILSVTGTNLVSKSGSTNDIDVTKLSVTGEGGNSYTLTSANVEITNATSFSVTLNATDKINVNGLLNKDGTSSATSGTTFNLAAAEDWAAGADSSVTIADTTSNTITVSNTQAPTITSATYNITTGALVVTGTNMVKQPGSANDIDLTKFTLTGLSAGTRTLSTSTNVEITSTTSFTATISGADKTAVDGLLDKDGTSSSDNTTYNLAAADDWNGPVTNGNIQDATGNGITVSGSNAIPTLTTMSNITGGVEESEKTITFANLTSAGNEADSDGSVVAFLVDSVTSGTLKIGTSSATATSYASGSNELINSTNNAYWTPATDANGTITAFSVKAQDDKGSNSATAINVNVEVANVNDKPVINNLNGDTTTIDLSDGDTNFIDLQLNAPLDKVNVTDVDSANFNGGYLLIHQTTGPTDGYFYSFDFSGSDDEVAYGDHTNLADGKTISANETVKFFNNSLGGALSIGTVDASLDGNQTDLRINFNSDFAVPQAASAILENLKFSAPSKGTRTFEVTINDGDSVNDTSDAVTFTMITPNQAPTSNDFNITINEDGNYTFSSSDFSFSDNDSGDTLQKVYITTLPAKGTMEINGTTISANTVINASSFSNLVYLPVANGFGSPYTTFGFKVNDGENNSTSQYTTTVNVIDVPGAPEFNSTISTQNILEGFADYNITINAYDEDNDTITSYSAISSNTNIVTVSMTGNVLTISKADENVYGDATVTVSVTAGGDTTTQTFTVSVSNVNDVPSIDTTFSNQTYDEDFTTKSFDINVSDIDGDNLELNVTSSDINKAVVVSNFTNPLNQADYSTTKSFSVTPVANANGNVTINISLGDGIDTNTTSFNITINPINDAPVIADISDVYVFSGTGNKDINISASDVDTGDTLTYSVDYGTNNIYDSNSTSSNVISLTPKSSLTTGSNTIQVSVSDGNLSDSTSFKYTIVEATDINITATGHIVTIGGVETNATSSGPNTQIDATSDGVKTTSDGSGVSAEVDTPNTGTRAGMTTHILTQNGVTTKMVSDVLGTHTVISNDGSGKPQIVSTYTDVNTTIQIDAYSNGTARHVVNSADGNTTTATSNIPGATTQITSSEATLTRAGTTTIQAMVITNKDGTSTTRFVNVSGDSVTSIRGLGLGNGYSYPSGGTFAIKDNGGVTEIEGNITIDSNNTIIGF